MKNTIRNTVKEVYNTDMKNITTNRSFSRSFSNHQNAPKNVNYYSNNNNNTFQESIDLSPSQTNSYWYILLIIFALFVTFGVVYYYRKVIKSEFQKWFNPEKTVSKEVVKIKEGGEELTERKTVSEKKDKIIEKDKLSIKKDGELVVDNKVVKESKKKEDRMDAPSSKKSQNTQYSEDKYVNQDDMYCYIGKDDDMRQCIQAFKGDVCTSGDIFNRIDECLVPRQTK
jgi:hypothetical protein|tara:strand:+ start:108 stop:788 length:681 start_codon:yes stop_codon:yes gene_type:complete